MAKGRFIERLTEGLVHDIPLYPFSSTTDGRTVAELHRGRIEAGDFQRESLAIQANTLEEISRLHGGRTEISPSEFQEEETRDVFMDMAGQLYDLRSSQEDTNTQLEGLNQTTAQGFGVLHDDNEEALAQNEQLLEQGEYGLAQGTISLAQGAYAIGQRNLTNYRLGAILDTMVDVNASIIDLTDVVEDFADMVNDGLSQIDRTLSKGFQAVETGLKNILIERVITRAAVLADLKRIERGIGTAGQQVTGAVNRGNAALERIERGIGAAGQQVTGAINRGNVALETLVHLNKTRHTVEADQHFEDAKKCLRTAKTKEDIKDAYEGFCKSAEIMRSSAEYQYGAGYTAELLGMLDEASSRYEKVTRRAEDEQKELASNAFVGIARIQHRQGDTKNALENTGKAIKLNKNNETAQFDECRYLLLLGLIDEALKKLEELIKTKPLYFAKMRADPTFKLIPVEKLRKFWKGLLDADAIDSPKILVLLLDDMIETESFDLARAMFFRLLEGEEDLKALIDRKIWLHPEFNKLNNKIIPGITDFIEKKMPRFTAKHCYTICSLLNYCGTTEIPLLKAFKISLKEDPLFYAVNKEEAKQKIRAKLSECMGNQTESILRKLEKACGNDTNYNWIF